MDLFTKAVVGVFFAFAIFWVCVTVLPTLIVVLTAAFFWAVPVVALWLVVWVIWTVVNRLTR